MPELHANFSDLVASLLVKRVCSEQMPVIPIVRSASCSLGIVPCGARVIHAATASPALTSNTASVAPSMACRTAIQITGIDDATAVPERLG